MSNILNSPIIIVILRIILGSVFIYASIDKIINPNEFARNIANYHIIPFGLENFIAIVLPWLELFIGIGLLVGFFVDGSAILSMGLLVIFIVAISSAILRGYNIECGCGLDEGELVGTKKLLENSILILTGLLVLNRKLKYLEFFSNSH